MEEKISDIKKRFEDADEKSMRLLVEEYLLSDKAGVVKLADKYRKQLEKLDAERQRVENMLSYEKEYGMYLNICGIDEAGRGPLAGPVVAAAVILPKDARLLYVNDSKQLSEKKREELYDVIMKEAVSVGVG
ncbi:MAG: ribonuclease HII, partial [Lachnospiraceae bacterium]